MSSIPQISLFEFMKFEDLNELQELKLILENLPDEELMRMLEDKRKNGRDDYPVRAMWNSAIDRVFNNMITNINMLKEKELNAEKSSKITGRVSTKKELQTVRR
jgi:hypothetical protein